MTNRVRRSQTSGQRGQVLPLTALFIVVLLGIGALVLDVARVYSLQRFERSVADAAALAGAQDLQIVGTRGVGAGQYTDARAHALDLLNRELGGTGTPTCAGSTASNIGNCAIPGTDYLVSIKTNPSPSAIDVDPMRAVQVTVRQPAVSLTFSRIPPFNQTTWNVEVTSVAGITFAGKYAVITLRPPNGVDTGAALGDITLNGTGSAGSPTRLVVKGGDIGTNRDALTNGGSSFVLDPGYRIDHFDPPTSWTPPPPGHKIRVLIPDPLYTIPSDTPTPVTYDDYTKGRDTTANCLSIVNTWLFSDPGYQKYVPGWPVSPDMSHIFCYRRGIYTDTFTDSNGDLSILEPGLYFFKGRTGPPQAVTLQSSLIGGYQPGSQGVAVVFPRDKQFKNNNTGVVSHNAGTRLGNPATGVEATPALDYSGNPIQTNTTANLIMTILVQKDLACTVTQPYPTACNDTSNTAIKLNGGSSLYLAGVQYAPSDNANLAGGVAGGGFVGQIVAWTLTYSGGTDIRQEYPGLEPNGVLRLDAACSGAGSGTVCNP